jgi:ATP-dependent DNA ligase
VVTESVCGLQVAGLAEGVGAKKRSGHYLPGRRGWIKTKNRAYWRYPLEVEAARFAAAGLRSPRNILRREMDPRRML